MNDKKSTRVAIVSDQAIYRRGLEALILTMPGVQLVGEARSSAEAIQLCQLAEPEVMLVDLKYPLGQGRQVAHQVHQHNPSTKVILLVDDEDQAPEEGDSAPIYYFSRDVSEEEFKAALSQIQLAPEREESTPGPAQVAFWHQAFEESDQTSTDEQKLVQWPAKPRNAEILARELVMAGKIQTDILPESVPSIPGWEIAAKLESARETSGDFYDFIPLTDHKLGIVVADVTDKGMGAALFMALSSTLIRTYATRFPTLPALALNAVNERILTDTHGSMFVTAFLGVLEPHIGRFVFANAGHPPAFVIRPQRGKTSIDHLRPTGMTLGVSEDAQWKQKVVKLSPGDILILYTDGITEAQNPHGVFFEEDRLLDAALSKADRSAGEIQEALLKEVHRFVGNVPPQDDIAVIVVRREE